ncbi:MAG: hypothetical protein Q7J39_12085 [Phenylobacterium sp.]|nr:hypothetical protein [Phenylobacterium sp.]
MRWVLIYAVTSALIFVGIFSINAERRSHFGKVGEVSEGVVTALTCDDHATLAYAYTHDGRTYSGADLSPDDCPTYRVGQTLPIWITRGHPERSRLSDPGDMLAKDREDALFGAAFLGFFLVLAARLGLKRRR